MMHAIRPGSLTPLQTEGLQEPAVERKYYGRRIIRLAGGRRRAEERKERKNRRSTGSERGKEVRLGKGREGKERRGVEVEEGKVKVGGWQRCLAREGWCGHGT